MRTKQRGISSGARYEKARGDTHAGRDCLASSSGNRSGTRKSLHSRGSRAGHVYSEVTAGFSDRAPESAENSEP